MNYLRWPRAISELKKVSWEEFECSAIKLWETVWVSKIVSYIFSYSSKAGLELWNLRWGVFKFRKQLFGIPVSNFPAFSESNPERPKFTYGW